MEAEQVVEKILADARGEADKIKKEADTKEAEEQALLDKQLSDYEKQTRALAEKAATDTKLHLLARARMNIAKRLLAEKRKILDDIFEKARKELKTLPDEQYKKLFTKLVLATVETGNEEVVVDKGESHIDHEFVRNINRQLGPGFKGNLRLAEVKKNIGGGFILKRGKITNNVSFDVMLDRARGDLEIELAKQLFEG